MKKFVFTYMYLPWCMYANIIVYVVTVV